MIIAPVPSRSIRRCVRLLGGSDQICINAFHRVLQCHLDLGVGSQFFARFTTGRRSNGRLTDIVYDTPDIVGFTGSGS
jgi:hypothetical protein